MQVRQILLSDSGVLSLLFCDQDPGFRFRTVQMSLVVFRAEEDRCPDERRLFEGLSYRDVI
jgi:hypothetical protein